MYVVDNLSFIESQLDFAREKYGVEVIKVPHWGIGKVKLRAYIVENRMYQISDCLIFTGISQPKPGLILYSRGLKNRIQCGGGNILNS